MIDGNYSITLKTPMGLKKGELALIGKDGVLTGKMSALGKENEINPGTYDGDNFSFSGELKTAVGRLAYDLSGTADGNTISGVAKTKKGDLILKGTRK